MEQRVGSILIQLTEKQAASRLNSIISQYSDIIISRQGIPMFDKGFSIVSLVVMGTNDQIGALAGQLGRVDGLQVKTALLKENN